jgi:hypothetical protein
MTNAEFAQQCAYFASRMASWAGDSLTLPEERNERVRDWVMANFLKDFRDRLDFIERVWKKSGVVHVDQRSAALDEMVRLDQEMGGR